MIPFPKTSSYYETKDYYNRYRKPVMHTETNVFDADKAPEWLWKQWMNIWAMRKQDVPMCGFTWYSLTDQIAWDIALAEKRGKVNECGLYDLYNYSLSVFPLHDQFV